MSVRAALPIALEAQNAPEVTVSAALVVEALLGDGRIRTDRAALLAPARGVVGTSLCALQVVGAASVVVARPTWPPTFG